MITKKQETRNKKQETRNKKQETRNYHDLLFISQGVSFREGNKSCSNDNGKGIQRLWKLQRKCCDSVRCLGHMDSGSGKHQSNSVYSILGISPTICAGGERMRQYTWILL